MDRVDVEMPMKGLPARVPREATGMQRYNKKLNEKEMRLVRAHAHVKGLNLTNNPSEADMELAMMAVLENYDEYEAIRLNKYVPDPVLKTAEARADYWIELWRVLNISGK